MPEHRHACGGLCVCAHPERENCPAHVDWPEDPTRRGAFAEEWYGEYVSLCLHCELPFREPFSHVYCPDD